MEKSAKDIDEKILKSTVVIVDIEGTTTSISFVKDTLFPYAAEKAGEFLAANWEVAEVQEAVEGMRKQAIKDIEDKVEGAVAIPEKDSDKDALIAAIASSVKWLVSVDSKAQHFKQLSGLIWEGGYKAGDLKGHLYKDVQPALESWRAAGRRIFVYSSGSVQAQQLLMKHSEHGDLQALFDGNFDTAVGMKQEMESYKNIIQKIECKPEEALFLTDVVKEGVAAREAGLNVALLVREGNAPLTDEDKTSFMFVESFADIPLAATTTKRKPETTQDEDLPPAKLAKTVTEKEATEKEATEKETEAVKPEKNGVTETVTEEAMEVDVDKVETNETDKECGDKESDKTENDSDKDQVPQAMETDSAPAKKETEVDNSEDATDKANVEVADVDVDVIFVKATEKAAIEEVAVETDKKDDKIDEKSDDIDKKEETAPVDDAKLEITKPEDQPVKEVVESVEITEKIDVIPPKDDAMEKDEKTEPEICPKPSEPDVAKEKEEVKIEKSPENIEVDTVVAAEESEVLAVKVVEKETEPETMETELAENGVTKSPTDEPIVDNESKMDDLLGEEGAALEKECAEILFKVDKDISSTETLIQKTIGDSNASLDNMETTESIVTPNDVQSDKAEIEIKESADPDPTPEEVTNTTSSDKTESSKVIPDVVTADDVKVVENIADKSPEPDTMKDENPPVAIEEKPATPAPTETEPETAKAEIETDDNDKVPNIVVESTSNSKVSTDSKEPDEASSIKTNGASVTETTNGNKSAVEERVNGKSCTETKDAEMNGKAPAEANDQNGEVTKEIVTQDKERENESDERTNGSTVEKKPHGWTADTGIPCEQE